MTDLTKKVYDITTGEEIAKVIFEKEYTYESIIDLDEDLMNRLHSNALPADKYGMIPGNFTVTITRTPE